MNELMITLQTMSSIAPNIATPVKVTMIEGTVCTSASTDT